MDQTYGVVYLITCLPTGKHYVGQTTRGVPQRWASHKVSVRFAIGCAIQKYGPESFTIQVVDTAVDQKDLDAKEILWISKLNSVSPEGYNLKKGGLGGKHTPDTIRKISERKRTQEEIEKSRAKHRGWVPSEETRSRMRAARIGMKFSPQHCENISKSNMGRVVSAETRAKISAAHKGKPRTPEAIEATRLGRWGKKSG